MHMHCACRFENCSSDRILVADTPKQDDYCLYHLCQCRTPLVFWCPGPGRGPAGVGQRVDVNYGGSAEWRENSSSPVEVSLGSDIKYRWRCLDATPVGMSEMRDLCLAVAVATTAQFVLGEDEGVQASQSSRQSSGCSDEMGRS